MGNVNKNPLVSPLIASPSPGSPASLLVGVDLRERWQPYEDIKVYND